MNKTLHNFVNNGNSETTTIKMENLDLVSIECKLIKCFMLFLIVQLFCTKLTLLIHKKYKIKF